MNVNTQNNHQDADASRSLGLTGGAGAIEDHFVSPSQHCARQQHEANGQTGPFAGRVDENYQILVGSTAADLDGADPHAAGLGGDLTSAILGIIKGMVGPAILYLPHGFATTGYALAIPTMCISTAMYLYASKCLLDAWKQESASQLTTLASSSSISSYKRAQMESAAPFRRLTYPGLARTALGPTGATIVKCGIALMQSGVCLTYLIFVPHNLHKSVRYLFNVDWSPTVWLCMMVLVEIPLSWITDIRRLTCTNFTANVLILYGLVLCMAFAFQSTTTSGDDDENENNSSNDTLFHRIQGLSPIASQWYLFMGTSVLLFEGSITLLIPLQEAIVTERGRQSFPHIYRRVILSIVVFYVFFAVLCWAAFGSDVHTVLTTSLPSGLEATSVQLAYSLAVVMTYPLQNFPAMEIATHSISSLLRGTFGCPKSWVKRNVISTCLCILLALVAVLAMNSLDKVVSLMGSLLGCPITFVVPPLIHSKLCCSSENSWRKRLNNFVAGAGVLAMVLASFVTLLEW